MTKRIIENHSESEDDAEVFIAKPSDDIPRNKLVEKLRNGL